MQEKVFRERMRCRVSSFQSIREQEREREREVEEIEVGPELTGG